MGRVHRHKHRGAVLALVALALQIAVTFGHVHLHGLGGSSHLLVAGQSSIAQSSIAQSSIAQASPQAPAQNPGDDDDYCAICASIFLASTAFAPTPPQLLVPTKFELIEHLLKSARPLTTSLRLAFRSRAPPAA